MFRKSISVHCTFIRDLRVLGISIRLNKTSNSAEFFHIAWIFSAIPNKFLFHQVNYQNIKLCSIVISLFNPQIFSFHFEIPYRVFLRYFNLSWKKSICLVFHGSNIYIQIPLAPFFLVMYSFKSLVRYKYKDNLGKMHNTYRSIV